jgi:hypothetical protein
MSKHFQNLKIYESSKPGDTKVIYQYDIAQNNNKWIVFSWYVFQNVRTQELFETHYNTKSKICDSYDEAYAEAIARKLTDD